MQSMKQSNRPQCTPTSVQMRERTDLRIMVSSPFGKVGCRAIISENSDFFSNYNYLINIEGLCIGIFDLACSSKMHVTANTKY